MKTKTIKVDYLARVEGEGALSIAIQDNKLDHVHLKIFEPPRFFEGFMRGREFSEAPDITARICGICPVAYQMSSAHAMEAACGVTLDGPLRELRRLLYCGEWIESHVLHMYMLHAPDFLGYESAIHMAADHAEVVKRGLHMKKVGNAIVNLLGGREIHPINVRLGGFYKIPPLEKFRELAEQLKTVRDEAVTTAQWAAGLDFPDFTQDYTFVALSHPDEYPFNEGRVISSDGLDLDVNDYETRFKEQHEERSTALHSVLDNHITYFVGPLARVNLNYDQLSLLTRQVADDICWERGCNNPFKSILARALETIYACDEAIRIIDELEMPEAPFVPVEPKAGVGCAATEAPRGILYHRYTIDEQGLIQNAKIVPPTSQNQRVIEKDLYHFVEQVMHEPDDKIQWQCEQAIRNYDPCISCSTHFLNLKVTRS
ncbi:MAG: Ni/Fe hydrogenase subunit alpha [Acidobacteriota bacterium]|nr:Ni/Fe hydrogenase subunit alpha [Acidobacteriota bacterium]